MADIKIAGHHFKQWEVWTVAIGGVGAVYLAYRAHAKAAAAAATSATQGNAIDPVTGLPYSQDSTIDPVTGQSYLQEAQQYGSVSSADSAASQSAQATDYGLGNEDYGGTAYGSGIAAGEPDYYATTASTAYSTDTEWESAAEAGLASLGYGAATVNSALACYLAGMQLTSSQAAIVQAAVAEYGPPPVGSYAINVAPSTTAAPTTTATPATATATATATAAKITPQLAPGGVHATTSGPVTTITWGAVSQASNYEFQLAEPGGSLYRDGTVNVASAVFDNLVDIKKGGWDFKVRALGTGGPGPWSSVITFTP